MVLISRHLGHSSISITSDIYSHVFVDEEKDLAKRMDRIYERYQNENLL